MTTYDSTGLVASRLENEISRSESRSRSQIAEVEMRLTNRIHQIERDAICRSKWYTETLAICLFVAWSGFILGIVVTHDSNRCTADAQPTVQTNQPGTDTPPAPSPHQDEAQ
jgi:hypothetical protein